jgi:hypothetical protein
MNSYEIVWYFIYTDEELAASISTDEIIKTYDLAASRKANVIYVDTYVILFWLRLEKDSITYN